MRPELLGTIADIAADLTHMANTMRNVLHLALSVSPILLLTPKKYSTLAIRRDHLITVSFTHSRFGCTEGCSQHALLFGHGKPHKLREAERAVWLLVFNFAAGIDKSYELERFFQRLDQVDALAGEPSDSAWFTQRKHASSSVYVL
jgi:hypothetical protein